VRKNLTRAVLDAIDAAPCSVRALAIEAGVSEALLRQLEQRDFDATPELAAKVATALEGWGTRCATAARRVRAAACRVPNLRTSRGKR
jgi:hypothetical protein